MAEVKEQIFARLKNIENEEFLNSILDLVINVDDEGVYRLSEEQKSDIDESIAQIERGEFVTHEEMIRKYLK